MSSISINTNVGAMVALQSLSSINFDLVETETRIATGLRVNSPKDDAGSFSIASRLQGDVAGYEAIRLGIGLGDAAVGVAVAASEQIKDILTEIEGKIVQKDGGTLSASEIDDVNDDITSLINQINTAATAASFNNINLVDGTTASLAVKTMPGSTNSIDVTGATLTATALGISTASTLADVEANKDSVLSALTTFGSAQKQLEFQSTFTQKLLDSLNAGIGTLIDADLAAESARLESLQVQLQLGVESLNIANSRPRVLLGLFNSTSSS